MCSTLNQIKNISRNNVSKKELTTKQKHRVNKNLIFFKIPKVLNFYFKIKSENS